MNRYVLFLDLKEDPVLIEEYEKWHRSVWPEVVASIRDSGIEHMEIYRFGNRLSMIMEVNDTFSFEQKQEADANNPKIQEWEELMWQYQIPVPGTNPGGKWVLAEKIFEL